MLWLVRRGSEEAEAALARTRATLEDMADAAPLGPRLGAFRLYRRRLLRSLAAEMLGAEPGAVRIERRPEGGLFIAAPELLHASVAASGDWTALALARHPIGVDVEMLTETHSVPLDLLHPAEREALLERDEADRSIAFLRFWTAREAYCKAQGRGLPAELSTIRAADDGDGVILFEEGRAPKQATLTITADLICAVVEYPNAD